VPSIASASRFPRDYLRTHPAELRRYAELKLRAARDSGGDWDRYSLAEHEYIQRVLQAALQPPSTAR
jgi:GrpB-like predicted nucleotidyltransferase (UPF0157 family)